MGSHRALEVRSWDPPVDMDLNDDETVRYWTHRLEVTRIELREVIERVSLSAHARQDGETATV
jgi:hypothetical protein